MKRGILLVFVIFLFTVSNVTAAEFEVEFPVLGKVGFINNSGHYSVSIGPLGTYAVEGSVKSSTEYDITTDLPAGEFTDYIPVVGQILGLFGLDTVKIHLSDKPSDGVAPDFGFGITLESGGLGLLRGSITETLSRVPGMGAVVDTVISALEIVDGELYGEVTNNALGEPAMFGTFNGTLSLLTMNIGFDFTGELSVTAIVKSLTDKIIPAATNYASEMSRYAYQKAKGAITGAYSSTAAVANRLFDEVGIIAHDVSVSVSHGKHSFDKCYNECTVNYANSQRERLLAGSNQIFQDFYNQIYRDIRKIEGLNATETMNLRKQALDADWFKMVNKFSAEWQKVYDDDEVENYFFKSSSERQARDRYRSMIQESWNNHKNFANNLYNQLMTIPPVIRVAGTAQQTYSILKNAARNGTALQFLHSQEDFAWDNPWNSQLYQNEISIHFWSKHDGWNQLWYLRPAKEENTYYIQSAQTGKYIHISRAIDKSGTTLVTFDGFGGDNTVFKAVADEQGYVSWYSKNGLAFDMYHGGTPENAADLQLWQPNNSVAQKFYIKIPSAQPPVKPGIFTQIINAEKGGMLNTEFGSIQGETDYKTGSGWHSAMWIFEPVNDGFFRIKNRWNGTYLHIETGKLEASPVPAGSWSSQWKVEIVEGTNYVRIQNKWKPDLYLHHNWAILECATILKEWKSAMWELKFVE